MDKIARRNRRKQSIRKKIFGTSDKPRMCVYKSNKNIYVQVIDDLEGRTLASASTALVEGEEGIKTRKNMKFAEKLGEEIAKKSQEKGITKIVFDRSGYLYHGVVKAMVDAARKQGLTF